MNKIFELLKHKVGIMVSAARGAGETHLFSNFRATLLLWIVILLFQNCATLITIPDWHKKNAPVFYSGTRCDVGLMMENGILYDPIYILDLPFSFVLDTILLPISLPLAAGMSRWHKQMNQFAPHCYDG